MAIRFGTAAIVVLTIAPGWIGLKSAHAANADCNQTGTAEEKRSCARSRVSQLDTILTTAFQQAKTAHLGRDAGSVLRYAPEFLETRAECGESLACVLGAQIHLLGLYRDAGATVTAPSWASAVGIAAVGPPVRHGGLPTHIGECVDTTVTGIFPRLGPTEHGPWAGNAWLSGTVITFANGVSSPSYEPERAWRASRPGDPALMCLVYLPRGCPPGDHRGKVYAVTNLRTGNSWENYDSLHNCGGA